MEIRADVSKTVKSWIPTPPATNPPHVKEILFLILPIDLSD